MANVRLEELLDYIRQGRIMDAMREFYAEDVVMEGPYHGSMTGLAENIVREEQFVNSVKEFRNFAVPRMAVGEDTAFYENVMDWLGTDDKEYHLEQVSVQTWKDGKITHERFYHTV